MADVFCSTDLKSNIIFSAASLKPSYTHPWGSQLKNALWESALGSLLCRSVLTSSSPGNGPKHLSATAI